MPLPRTGRPPKQETARSEELKIRLTKEEKINIQYCADKLNISRTDAIIMGIKLLKEKLETE